MIKLDQPWIEGEYGPLFLRLFLGGYFVLAGLAKLEDLPGFVGAVESFGVLPTNFAVLYAGTLPYAEIIIGGMLILGFWMSLSACACALLLLSYVIAMGIAPNYPFNKDIILIAGALSLMSTGAGAYSLDRFKGPGGHSAGGHGAAHGAGH